MGASLNPYDYGRPVMDHTAFAGRLKLLEKVDYTIGLATSERPQYRNLAITGSRGIGKTSLLNQIAYLGGINGLLAARVELNNELASSQAALFHQILDDIASKLHGAQRLGGARGWLQRVRGKASVEVELNLFIGQLKAASRDSTDVPQEALRKSLRDAFRGARRAGKKAIMICIDEADLLAKDETVLQALRNTFQQEEGYILIIAGREDLLANLGKVFGPMQRFFDQVTLGPFENAVEVRECLEAPLEAEERAIVTPRFAGEVLEMTGGLPYLVKLMAFHAYRTMQNGGLKRLGLSPEIVNETLQGARTSEAAEDLAEKLKRRLSEPFEVDEPDLVTLLSDEADEAAEPALPGLGMPINGQDESPVIKFVNGMFETAVTRGATQILFVPAAKNLGVRMRLDGVMTDIAEAPASLNTSVAARLKIMARLDISERRMPQAGVMKVRIANRDIEAHVQTTPSQHGESLSIQLRAADRHGPMVALEATGLSPRDLEAIDAAGLGLPGLIAVASATNHGKTTTLYGLLARALTPGRYAATVEGDFAGSLPGVSQHKTRPRAGLTMVNLLRSVLAQEPDLLLVDPVLEAELATAMVEATFVGCSVLCGLYADDALAGLVALRDHGVGGSAAARSLKAIIGQKLLRRLCDTCKSRETRGCADCGESGFKGRIGVFQVLTIDDEMRNALRENRPFEELRRLAEGSGLQPLRDLALEKVREGLTTDEEVVRVFR